MSKHLGLSNLGSSQTAEHVWGDSLRILKKKQVPSKVHVRSALKTLRQSWGHCKLAWATWWVLNYFLDLFI